MSYVESSCSRESSDKEIHEALTLMDDSQKGVIWSSDLDRVLNSYSNLTEEEIEMAMWLATPDGKNMFRITDIMKGLNA